MNIIYDNKPLTYIIQCILNGTAGFSNINELLIINENLAKYNQIIIKPCSIDISAQILEFLNESKIKPELVDTEIEEFVCYTKTIDEETNQEILLNMSLTEFILTDNELLNSTGWKLIDFTEY